MTSGCGTLCCGNFTTKLTLRRDAADRACLPRALGISLYASRVLELRTACSMVEINIVLAKSDSIQSCF